MLPNCSDRLQLAQDPGSLTRTCGNILTVYSG